MLRCCRFVLVKLSSTTALPISTGRQGFVLYSAAANPVVGCPLPQAPVLQRQLGARHAQLLAWSSSGFCAGGGVQLRLSGTRRPAGRRCLHPHPRRSPPGATAPLLLRRRRRRPGLVQGFKFLAVGGLQLACTFVGPFDWPSICFQPRPGFWSLPPFPWPQESRRFYPARVCAGTTRGAGSRPLNGLLSGQGRSRGRSRPHRGPSSRCC